MTEQPTQEPFEPYRPGPAGGEQPHPSAVRAQQQTPLPWAAQAPRPQSPYGYGYGYANGPGRQQTHHQAGLVLVLGIISIFFSLVGPVAWVMGARAKKEIEASGGRLGGMSQVMVGYVIGIVMSVLTALVALMVVGVFVFVLVVLIAGT